MKIKRSLNLISSFNWSYTISISCFLQEIDPIFNLFKNFDFMSSWRYWSQIQDFQEFIKRIVNLVRAPSFQSNSKMSSHKNLKFPKWTFHIKDLMCSCSFWNILVSPTSNIIGCWESWSRPLGPKTMTMRGFRVFPKCLKGH